MRKHRFGTTLGGAVCLVALLGCGSPDEGSSAATTITDPTPTPNPPTTTNPPTTQTTATTAQSPTTTTATSTASTTTVTTATTTTATVVTQPVSVRVPEGSFSAGPTDLYVLALDGDLELWPETLAAPPARRITVVDYPDPFDPDPEGPAPNVIDDLAGEIRGSIVFGDCCEPIAGNIRVATEAGQVTTIGAGYTPSVSPSGDRLASANDFQITVTSLDTDEGFVRLLDQDPYLNVADLIWSNNASSTPVDDHLVLLGWTQDAGWSLYAVDGTTLEPVEALELDIPPVAQAPDVDVRFAGIGPDAEIVVAESTAATTRLRYFSPTSLAELPMLERSLPASADSIRVAQNDLLWVDDGDVLYFLRGGTLEPVRLGSGVLAAWYP